MPEGSWPAETLSDASRAAFYKAALDRYESAEADTKAVRRQGFLFGCGGMLVGVLGMAAALTVYHKAPLPEPPGYILVDKSTGWIGQPMTAIDIPAYYPEATKDAALRDFIVSCESYVPQTWAKIAWHACMIQATPDEQRRREADIGRNGARYPVALFGPTGWAMPTDFPPGAFVNIGETGTGTSKTYNYRVRYRRTEVINGRESLVPYSAEIQFQFHPELKISPADRLINRTGLQVLAFSTVRDQ